ncbi:MAG: hypothetical protein ABFS32_09120 [Bacteroidota bacterium]
MRLIFSLVIILSSFAGYAQVKQPNRYEVELDLFDESFDVLPGEENGVLLYRAMDKFKSGHELWQFIKLDTALNEDWSEEYYIDLDYEYRGYDYHSGNFSLLFEIAEYNTHDLMLIQLNATTGDTTYHRIKNLVSIELREFEMSETAAIIGGYYNNNPVVIHYNLETKKTRVLPGIFGNRTEIVQLKVEGDLIKMLVSTRTLDKQNTLALKTYSSDGEYLYNYVFEPKDETGLIFGRIANTGNDDNLVCGTYGMRRSDYSRGLFIARHRENEKQELGYFDYVDLENFFTYMRAKRQSRVSKRISRKKIKGKKARFNYRLLVHDVIENDGAYIMIGEAFYPKYENNSYYGNYGYYGGNYGRYQGNNYGISSFAGYKYTHAVIVGFDKKGEMLWDNSFEIEDVQTFSLEQFVHADVVNDKVILLYLYNNEIRTKVISGGKVLEGKSFDNVKLSFGDDVANTNSYSDIGGLEKWYGHNFIAYGMQRIKNLRDSGVKLNRRVFYVNKIYYTNQDNPKTEQSE